MSDDALDTLQDRLEHRFGRPELLELALTHTSAARPEANRAETNERLEFLGDRVLGLVVARLLYDRFPDEAEGELARRHAALVRRDSLARVAAQAGLGEAMRMSRSESDSGGRDNPGILADCGEAVIAALYLDGGIKAAEGFILKYWPPLVDEDPTPPKDAKTALQEWAQGRGLPLPAYREVKREGPAHAPVFTVEVAVKGQAPAEADGGSKRNAEQAAAKVLLERLVEKEEGGR